MVRWGEMKTDKKAWRLYRGKKKKVCLCLDIPSLFYQKFCLHTHWGLSYSFVQGHVKRGPGTETPVPPQWAALGCGLALWAAGQLSLTAPSNTVHPTPLTLSESGRGAQLPWGSWQVVSGRQGDCISGGECGMRCLDGSGWPYFIVSL